MSRASLWIPLLALASLFFGWRGYDAWTVPAKAVGLAPPRTAVAPFGVSSEDPPQAADLVAPVAVIVARPVFRPDRRPFQETAVTVPTRNYEQELSRFTLLGVLQFGDMKKAVITGKTPGRTERYEIGPGESLPGFEVKEIQQEGVLLTADGKEFLLPLYAGAPKVQGPGGLRTELPPPPSTGASPPAGQARPPAAPVQAGSGAASGRGETAGEIPGRAQPPAAVAAPGQPGTAPPSPSTYRGRLRPTFLPGQR